MKSYAEAIMFLTSDTDFSHLDNEELDFLYHCAFDRLAWHMSREGYIRSLEIKRQELAILKEARENYKPFSEI